MKATMEKDNTAAWALLSLKDQEVGCYYPKKKRRERESFPTSDTWKHPRDSAWSSSAQKKKLVSKKTVGKIKRNLKPRPALRLAKKHHTQMLAMPDEERPEQRERQEQERKEQERQEYVRKEQERFRKGRQYIFAILRGKAPETFGSAAYVAANRIMLQIV
jgi:hypothetical protein